MLFIDPVLNRFNDSDRAWKQICRDALNGVSFHALAAKHHISVHDIKDHLSSFLGLDHPDQPSKARSATEMNLASFQARNDLVSFLLGAINDLNHSDRPKLDPKQLNAFYQLINASARLFAWPTVSLSKHDSTHTAIALDKANAAVNLDLINTPPEQLARLAVAQFNPNLNHHNSDFLDQKHDISDSGTQ